MEDVLSAFLKPETVARLQERACTHPHARRYLLMLRLSALLIQQAQGEEEASAEWIDQAVITTLHNLKAMFADGLTGAAALLSEMAGDVALDYCQKRERITRAGKTALLLRLSQLIENGGRIR